MLTIKLAKLSSDQVIGIYGPGKNALPERMRLLHPEAARNYLDHLADKLVLSDMYRSAEGSLLAVKTRAGSQRPGYSGHNMGLSVDMDVTKTMKRVGVTTKAALDAWLEESNWFCHRRDHLRKMEEWHANFDIKAFIKPSDKTTAPALERKILSLYGEGFKLDAVEIQTALKKLSLYKGSLDGKLGPLSRTALEIFQRAWALPATGKTDVMTVRTLAFVTAEIETVPL